MRYRSKVVGMHSNDDAEMTTSPSARLIDRCLVRIGAFAFLGYLPASGTTTVVVIGVPLFWFMHRLSAEWYVLTTALLIASAVFIHQIGDRILNEKDSRILVWDEIVGFVVAVAFVPFTWQLAVVAVLIERALDITKVPPAGWIERNIPGGLGVVGDDIVAGLYACGLLHLLMNLAPGWMGVAP